MYCATTDTMAKRAETEKQIFLDNQSSTPIDPRVIDAISFALKNHYGNPHSISHSYGWNSAALIEEARSEVAKLIGAESSEIIFTSGATESNNIAIKGAANYEKRCGGSKRHIITTLIEHKCVLESCRFLSLNGFEIEYLPVDKFGIVDVEELEKRIRPGSTLLVSVIAVSNEIGSIQPMEEIGSLCKKYDILFHSDGAQAVGKIPINVNNWGVDLLSMSGHKIYGPKGVGALFVRKKPKRARLDPLFSGGDQERGLRPGTLAAPIVFGFGVAAKICCEEMDADSMHVKILYNKMYEAISTMKDVFLNGHPEKRYFGNMNWSFSCVEGESLMVYLPKLALSSGSACNSNSLEPSYVLKSMNVPEDLAHSSIRIGFGRFNTINEIEEASCMIMDAVSSLRKISPLWDMVQNGVDLSKINWASSH